MAAPFRELRLEGLRRDFGALNALKGVSLTVAQGEFIALLGPSGCGKSTALNCVAGLLALTGGAIRLDERRVDGLPPEARGFGMVFQNYALFPHMSVARNVGFGLRMRGLPRAELDAKVARALELVQLTGQAPKLPGQLSGGQQQRVAIARALAVEPSLVLMDEPLSNLDAKLRLEMRAEIQRIHREAARTTIYVTHDQDEALSLADRVVVMREGEVRQVGAPADVFDRPATLDVARFMGFRTLVEGALEGDAVRAGGALLRGTRVDAAGPRAVAAIRPDDLRPGPEGVAGRVEMTEYRGRDHAGLARGEGGEALHFACDAAIAPGEVVRLSAPPGRVRLYAPGAA